MVSETVAPRAWPKQNARPLNLQHTTLAHPTRPIPQAKGAGRRCLCRPTPGVPCVPSRLTSARRGAASPRPRRRWASEATRAAQAPAPWAARRWRCGCCCVGRATCSPPMKAPCVACRHAVRLPVCRDARLQHAEAAALRVCSTQDVPQARCCNIRHLMISIDRDGDGELLCPVDNKCVRLQPT